MTCSADCNFKEICLFSKLKLQFNDNVNLDKKYINNCLEVEGNAKTIIDRKTKKK